MPGSSITASDEQVRNKLNIDRTDFLSTSERSNNMPNQPLFSAPPSSIDDALWEADRVRLLILNEAENPNFPAPPEGKWSIDDLLYHIHLVERGSASAIRKMIESEKGERFSDEAVAKTWQRMNAFVPNRNTKILAPDGVTPKDTPSRAACIRLLNESRERLKSHCSKTTTDDLLRISFPHPALGAIPGLLWITFIAMHEARHLEQILELNTQAIG
jgi:hypothetical protein